MSDDTFTPTPEQEAIVKLGTSSDSNLMIEALAGAAKTSTLVLLAHALRGQDILCLAFNKKIKLEMEERLPDWCTSSTLNSLGHRAFGSFIHRKIYLNKAKNYHILKQWIEDNLDGDDKEYFWEHLYEDTKDALGKAKSAGYVPEDVLAQRSNFKSLMTDEEFEEWLDFEADPLQLAAIRECLATSIDMAMMEAHIDYDDQIYISTLCTSVSFRYHSIVLIDEAQDLSALNHEMLWKITRRGKARLIAVGDQCQAIYGFRGAHQDSMELLAERFNPMTRMPLTISFRCPRTVVGEALWRAPTMRYPEWAIEGRVRKLAGWDVDALPDQATIICRNNAPLFNMAITLFANGRHAKLAAGDISKYFLKILEGLGSPDMKIDDVNTALDLWLERERAKRKDGDRVNDIAACLRIITTREEVRNLADCVTDLKTLFARTGPIELMTGHRSKGLEFPHVFILDKQLLRIDKEQQEKNLLYVMQTRATESLTYIETEKFLGRTAEDRT